MADLESFYQGKKVLITGHTGFKGSWLATWLKLLGARVVGFALPAPDNQPSLFQAARVGEGMVDVSGDVRDQSAVESVFAEHAPEVVFHLAAQALVRRSYQDPVTTYATNVLGTVHILESARQNPSVRAVVNVTTDKCYENREAANGYQEDDRLGGYDPYSSSKACAELVTAAFRNSFFAGEHIGLATARAGNVIGGGDWAEDRIVPDFIRAMTTGQPIVLRRPDAVRPWQFVLDPLHGYLRLAARLWDDRSSFSSAWNFGPNDRSHVPVLELAQKLVNGWGSGRIETLPQNDKNMHETSLLRLNCDKARMKLNWTPLLGIDDTINLTAEWYKSYYQTPGDVEEITRRQIAGYMQHVTHSRAA